MGSVDLGEGRALYAESYCLRTDSYDDALRNWELQASNDTKTWVTLKRHEEDSSLDTTSMSVAAWPLAQDTAAYYRHFRIFQFGPDSTNRNYLSCCGIEFCGKLLG